MEPQDLRHLFPGHKVTNPVQIVKKHQEMHFAFCKAFREVETEFFTIYDNDDPLPILPETFPNVGLIYGDNIIIEDKVERVFPISPWTLLKHAASPQFIHRAICRTEDANRILQPVCDLPIWTEWWLFLHLAHENGHHYDPAIKMYWDKKETGLHTRTSGVIANTRALLKERYL